MSYRVEGRNSYSKSRIRLNSNQSNDNVMQTNMGPGKTEVLEKVKERVMKRAWF